ncbi:MAG: hypothetical protein ACK46A_07560, partial [Akkermansiaceae bacterium]
MQSQALSVFDFPFLLLILLMPNDREIAKPVESSKLNQTASSALPSASHKVDFSREIGYNNRSEMEPKTA